MKGDVDTDPGRPWHKQSEAMTPLTEDDMATHKLTTPIRVGDLANGITVDALDLVSISINFQPLLDTPKGSPSHIKYLRDRVIVSCMLHHAASGWIHTVTLSEHTGFTSRADLTGSGSTDHSPISKGVLAEEMWVALKKKFPDFEKEVLALLAPHLPPGTQA